MPDGRVLPSKRCMTCGGEYLLDFFRLNAGPNGSSSPNPRTERYRDRCIGCDAIRKRTEPLERRLRRKAIAARRRHGARFKELGVIKDELDLEEVYGWSVKEMMSDISRLIDKGCPYCLQPVDTSESDFGVITIDVVNVDQAPHYSTNVRWCCSRCNSEKQRTPADVWAARQSMWKRWRQTQIRCGVDPEEFGFLPLNDTEAHAQPSLF
jgi:hypothetical protein